LGFKIGWDDKNNKPIILDQWKGENGSLQRRNNYDAKQEDWSVVNATKRYDPKTSTSRIEASPPRGIPPQKDQ
jgi:hypothetical protein